MPSIPYFVNKDPAKQETSYRGSMPSIPYFVNKDPGVSTQQKHATRAYTEPGASVECRRRAGGLSRAGCGFIDPPPNVIGGKVLTHPHDQPTITQPPLCARSSLCSVSTQCWRSSPCTDMGFDSLQMRTLHSILTFSRRLLKSSGLACDSVHRVAHFPRGGRCRGDTCNTGHNFGLVWQKEQEYLLKGKREIFEGPKSTLAHELGPRNSTPYIGPSDRMSNQTSEPL
ncbi:hypothetical protein DNTS_025930 [Danionella cerebrum]|uniref:Uncharacterized protein n=1 Tax=Danionella cerebrum TaxID=2873325 RepID=A0A553QFS2_9TELE|nr:hypothetical protein DNTS_025930 [Danionella translucida]